jgi:hypothetical protein
MLENAIGSGKEKLLFLGHLGTWKLLLYISYGNAVAGVGAWLSGPSTVGTAKRETSWLSGPSMVDTAKRELPFKANNI